MPADQAAKMQEHLEQLVAAQDKKLSTLIEMMTEMSKNMAELRDANRSSSTSGLRFACPLGCGADFKKVHRICNAFNFTDIVQVTYLMDHLCRSCKISKRAAVQGADQVCKFDPAVNANHMALWLRVLPSGAEMNDQNVRLWIDMVRMVLLINNINHLRCSQKRHWCSQMALAAPKAFDPDSPSMKATGCPSVQSFSGTVLHLPVEQEPGEAPWLNAGSFRASPQLGFPA